MMNLDSYNQSNLSLHLTLIASSHLHKITAFEARRKPKVNNVK